jgi:hypothetical protein
MAMLWVWRGIARFQTLQHLYQNMRVRECLLLWKNMHNPDKMDTIYHSLHLIVVSQIRDFDKDVPKKFLSI